MRAVTIGQNEAGQRLDKFLNKYMKEAGVSFFYKMMRKKNIVLNGKKCTGKEILLIGDEVKLFLAEETLEKFEDCMNEMHSITERDAFSYGFRLGVRLMAESFLLPLGEDEAL